MALSNASNHRLLTSTPTAQRLSFCRCSSSNSAGASWAALASRANFSLSHNHSRPRLALCSPANSRPNAQLISRIRFKPSRLPKAQNTFTGVRPLPSAANARPAPLMTATIASSTSARRAPCSQRVRATVSPSRSARCKARCWIRVGRSPPAVRARRLASRSSSGPACSSRRRTVSVSQSVCSGVTRSPVVFVSLEHNPWLGALVFSSP
ncbi:hypothetical protein [Pseudomonas sp. 22 E 5]|nr:hypothetical protein [Pseudomonas sp. 22 E 5]